MALAVACLLSVGVAGSYYLNTLQTRDMLNEQAYILSQEMSALWDFAAVNQDRINHDADGNYDFKGLHCSIVGTSVGALFTSRTDYAIRYISDTPRNPQNQADEFELKAIEAFRADESLNVYDGFAPLHSKGKESYYRYVIPLKMEKSCDSCHGDPKGEIDITGYEKEGFQRNDLVGAASISIPTAIYDEATLERTALQVGLGFLLLAGCLTALFFYVTRYITHPLEKIAQAVQGASASGLSNILDPDAIKAKDEVRDLVQHLNETTERLAALHANLESEVSQRTRQLATANKELSEQAQHLEEMNEKLAMAGRYKTHYFTMMSHELKTPLTAIKAYADMLKATGAADGEQAASIITKMQANIASLTKLIGNVLEMTKLEDGKVELERQTVDAVDIVTALAKTLDPVAQTKNVDVYYVISKNMPLILVDQDKILHVLENLGSNAIKYSPEGGVVTVDARLCRKDSTIQFAVSDNGPGISESDQKLIFEKYVQAKGSLDRPVSGTGLGLALAKEYVELHGGRIELRSAPGEGSIFKVVLPFEEPFCPENEE